MGAVPWNETAVGLAGDRAADDVADRHDLVAAALGFARRALHETIEITHGFSDIFEQEQDGTLRVAVDRIHEYERLS
mgnify:CR=1 FL=1